MGTRRTYLEPSLPPLLQAVRPRGQFHEIGRRLAGLETHSWGHFAAVLEWFALSLFLLSCDCFRNCFVANLQFRVASVLVRHPVVFLACVFEK